MASFIPGGGGQVPGPIQPQGGGGPAQLVELALAVKSFKMKEAATKRTEAQEKLQMLMSNPQLLLMTDHKDLEKAFKDAYDMKFTADAPMTPDSMQQMIQQGQAKEKGTSGGTSANVDPNAIASVANATQGNKAGAQSGTPPSSNAANKAPGGGVEKTGNPELVEHLASAAQQHLNQKFGAMAPLYGSAMGQLNMEQVKAQTMMDIEHLKQGAANGNLQDMGRLFQMSNKNVTDADLRAMVVSAGGFNSSDPERNAKAVNDALNFALGNETDADKAKRFDSTLKTMAGTPEIMSKFVNPLDVTEFSRSVVYGGSLPQGMNLKPLTTQELTEEAKYEEYLVKTVGLPGDYSHLVARARSMGMDVNLSMPKGFQTITQRETGAKEKQASASMLSAQADMIKAHAEFDKVSASIRTKVGDDLNEQLRTMIEADKAKHPYPQAVQDALINKIAEQTGLMPEQVSNWHSWITGKEWKYTPSPDSDLAKAAAGGAGPTSKPKKREKTVAEKGGLIPNTGLENEPPMKVPSGPLGEGKAVNKALDLTINPLYEILFGKKPEGL